MLPPEFLADRDLGKRVVDALREAGHVIHTLADVFGKDDSQFTLDTEWIRVAGEHGWATLTKNKNIRYNTEEHEAVAAAGIALFALANGNMLVEAMTNALLTAMPAMIRAHHRRSGGCLYIVHRRGELSPVRIGIRPPRA